MFDFRYHVVSLAAVFLALVIGILVGIGLSGQGFVDDAERKNLQQEIGNLRSDLELQRQAAGVATSRLLALEDLADELAPTLLEGALTGKRVALLYVGGVPGPVNQAVRRAVADAGGRIARMEAVRVPYEQTAVDRALADRPALRALAASGPDDVGRALGHELLAGGRTPLWRALARPLVVDHTGDRAASVDAVVVAGVAPPQQGDTETFLSALYTAVGAQGLPAVGVQESGATLDAVPVFARRGLSTVDSVDTSAGRLAVVLVLAGAEHGSYGVEDTAEDGILPSIDDLPR